MKVIEIKPTKKFGGAWCAEEAPGVAPCFPEATGKQYAVDYPRNSRFGGASGEIRLFGSRRKRRRRNPSPKTARRWCLADLDMFEFQ
jgi:hypothetical protein